jgi:GTP cyclohydrolase I
MYYHLFGFVKDHLRGQRFETREAIQKAMRQCLRMAGTEFYRRGIFKLPERWEKCVQSSGDYVEK